MINSVPGMRQVEMGLLSHGLQKPPRVRGMKSGESEVVLGTQHPASTQPATKLLEKGPMSTEELSWDLKGTKLLSKYSPTASKGKVE